VPEKHLQGLWLFPAPRQSPDGAWQTLNSICQDPGGEAAGSRSSCSLVTGVRWMQGT
jgi:hypothetical protein